MIIQLSTFFKKNDELGAVELAVPGDAAKGWTFNGVELAPGVAEYLIRYGLKQSLADCIASAKTLAEAEGLYDKRRNAMLTNTIGVRESGGLKTADDPILALAIKNAKAALMTRFEKVLPDAKRMADYCKHPKIAPYFRLDKQDAAKAVWIDSAVVDWMDRTLAGGGKDFRAEAAETLAVDVSVDLDF